ncbi:MAG: transcriptional repressor LexA [Patescibacteria group bacterium]|nr:transcriptional repressor LexA [Patescibacteria group bacterium]
MGDKKLTKRQRQVLDFIADFDDANGYAPSYREIGIHFGLSSPATIHEHVKSLEEKGFLKYEPNMARSVEIVKLKTNWAQAIELSLAGLITAGEPIEAIETNEKIVVPPSIATNPESMFVLKVSGDSMIEDGILDGDLVVCEKRESADNGDTVVALIDNQYATLKRFYREHGKVRLQPANKRLKPFYPENIIVQGIVRGLIRKMA